MEEQNEGGMPQLGMPEVHKWLFDDRVLIEQLKILLQKKEEQLLSAQQEIAKLRKRVEELEPGNEQVPENVKNLPPARG